MKAVNDELGIAGQLIADDYLNDIEPWHGIIDRYKVLRSMMDRQLVCLRMRVESRVNG
jgi:hypothetical protein